MYVTGTQYTYENRIHQLIRTTGDFYTFCIEGSGYLSQVNLIHLNKWNRELEHVYYELTKIAHPVPFLITGGSGISPSSSFFILQNGGYFNLVNGGKLTLMNQISSSNNIITENLNILITENGDAIIQE